MQISICIKKFIFNWHQKFFMSISVGRKKNYAKRFYKLQTRYIGFGLGRTSVYCKIITKIKALGDNRKLLLTRQMLRCIWYTLLAGHSHLLIIEHVWSVRILCCRTGWLCETLRKRILP